MRIYLIDDDEVSIFLFKSTIEMVGPPHDLLTFIAAGEVLKVLDLQGAEFYPDIMFIDLSMPVMDGWDLLEELEHRHPALADKCRVYILTSSIRETDKARGNAHPLVAGFLSKPLKKEMVQQILSSTFSEACT